MSDTPPSEPGSTPRALRPPVGTGADAGSSREANSSPLAARPDASLPHPADSDALLPDEPDTAEPRGQPESEALGAEPPDLCRISSDLALQKGQ